MLSSSNNRSISVIVVTRNSSVHIEKCLKSLLLHENSYIKEIILIDNASKDNTLKIASKFNSKKIKLLKQKVNLGFSVAVNKGIKISIGKYILLLNPDTEFFKESLCPLLTAINFIGGGVSGGKMVGGGGCIHNTHVRNPNLLIGLFDVTNLCKIFPNNRWHKSFYYLDSKPKNSNIEVDAVSGGYMLIKREVVDVVGGLNDNYFMYLEDVEYCKRVRESGFKVMYCPESIIFHEGGASSENKDRINFNAWIESRSYFFWNNHSKLTNLVIQPMFLVDELVMRIWRKIR